MTLVVLVLVGVLTVLWVGIVAGIWAFVSVTDEHQLERSSVAPEE